MIDSIRNGNKIETEELNETAHKIEKSEDACHHYVQNRKTLYASRIMKQMFLENSKRRKSSSN